MITKVIGRNAALFLSVQIFLPAGLLMAKGFSGNSDVAAFIETKLYLTQRLIYDTASVRKSGGAIPFKAK